uniref:Uncharacterized protein n=1 Tax=Arundo donax TaxID=35708 RepID=A0A0A9C411_ARUDO
MYLVPGFLVIDGQRYLRTYRNKCNQFAMQQDKFSEIQAHSNGIARQ